MTAAPVPYVEPWLCGTYSEVPAVGRAVLHALDLALDDITKWTAGLTDAETHAQPLGLPSLAFHLRHIARSVDRILTYAEGGQLTAEQLAALKAEQSAPQPRTPNRSRSCSVKSKPRFPTRPTAFALSPAPTSTSFAASVASNCPPPSAGR